MSKDQAEKKSLAPAEVAAELGISVAAVYNLIQKGALHAMNLASGSRGLYRIKREWLDEFMAQRRVVVVQTPRSRPSKQPAVRDFLNL